MQQTEKYNLNLIETSDTFSPAPLNENMEKLEAAIIAGDAAEAEARAADCAALEQRVVSLEGKHVVAGVYTGDADAYGVYQTIDLGFTPIVVAASLGLAKEAVLVWEGGGWSSASSHGPCLEIMEGGFRVRSAQYIELNTKNRQYPFIAIG